LIEDIVIAPARKERVTMSLRRIPFRNGVRCYIVADGMVECKLSKPRYRYLFPA
jgi:hypothetical protein